MKRMNVSRALIMLACILSSGLSMAAMDCTQLKNKIEKNIQSKGVKSYTLDIVDAKQSTSKKVVGTCNGNKRKIVYEKTK